jgi:DNA-binding response OmpR family regulator
MLGPLARHSTPASDILIVDDEPSVLVVHEALLASQGHRISTAASPEEALARVAAGPPDLIISDLMMPRFDGVELVRKLRENPDTRDIPVVLMSVLDDRETRIRACEYADAFLNKPVDGLELLLRVRLLLQQRARVRELLTENARLQAENRRLTRR